MINLSGEEFEALKEQLEDSKEDQATLKIAQKNEADLWDICTKQKKKIEKLREALSFYADKKNWNLKGRGLNLYFYTEIIDDSTRFKTNEEYGGKRARQVLEEIK